VRDGLRALPIARDYRNARTIRCQPLADGLADASAATGDERDLPA
jgi:hypothetical protein